MKIQYHKMIKLFIHKSEQSRIKNIFEFLARTNSKVYLTPEGLDYSNAHGLGKIHKDFFINYAVAGTKRITILDDSKVMKVWIKNWKLKENALVEINF